MNESRHIGTQGHLVPKSGSQSLFKNNDKAIQGERVKRGRERAEPSIQRGPRGLIDAGYPWTDPNIPILL